MMLELQYQHHTGGVARNTSDSIVLCEGQWNISFLHGTHTL